MQHRFFVILIAAAVAAGSALTALGAQVHVRVVDGDTFVLDGETIRIWGIDAPELDEPSGETSKRFLSQYLRELGHVQCKGLYRDPYGRMVARCFSSQGSDIACRIVSEGHARDWPRYSGGRYRACSRKHP